MYGATGYDDCASKDTMRDVMLWVFRCLRSQAKYRGDYSEFNIHSDKSGSQARESGQRKQERKLPRDSRKSFPGNSFCERPWESAVCEGFNYGDECFMLERALRTWVEPTVLCMVKNGAEDKSCWDID